MLSSKVGGKRMKRHGQKSTKFLKMKVKHIKHIAFKGPPPCNTTCFMIEQKTHIKNYSKKIYKKWVIFTLKEDDNIVGYVCAFIYIYNIYAYYTYIAFISTYI